MRGTSLLPLCLAEILYIQQIAVTIQNKGKRYLGFTKARQGHVLVWVINQSLIVII